jgi:cell volume regulation protein A
LLTVELLILIGSVLLLLGILSSKFSSRMGMPVLVMFLGLGMLAGSEGIGGIAFEDYYLSYAIGTFALAIILFSGGLSTPFTAVRDAWKPASVLATFGVLITASITGVAAAWILKIDLKQGLLLGSIVGSTDAAAVFSILRTGGVHLRRRLSDTLEVESGSNDPMAIFLTVGLIQILIGKVESINGLIGLLISQMGIGLLAGLAFGYMAVWVIRNIHLDTAGLYPILATAFGLLSFGMAVQMGGSGFLSVYITGMVIGNKKVVFQRGIEMFHDAGAWMAQIVMFIVLGLLSFPSRLLAVWLPGLAIAAVLLIVARPIAVFLCLCRSRFSFREQLFLSWVGLKGAVPITLAIFPLLSNLDSEIKIESANIIFDVVFFVVLVSAVLQGWSLPWVARKLGLEIPAKKESAVTLEISSLKDVEGDIVDYFVDSECRVAGKLIRELALPEEVVVALIVHNQKIKLPKGSSRIEAGDHVIVVLRPHVRAMVDRIFSRPYGAGADQKWPASSEFPLRADIKIGDLESFYGITIGEEKGLSLEEWLTRQIEPDLLAADQFVDRAMLRLRIMEMNSQGKIVLVGMSFISPENISSNEPSHGS